jgi:hypothetical protein
MSEQEVSIATKRMQGAPKSAPSHTVPRPTAPDQTKPCPTAPRPAMAHRARPRLNA